MLMSYLCTEQINDPQLEPITHKINKRIRTYLGTNHWLQDEPTSFNVAQESRASPAYVIGHASPRADVTAP